MNIEQAIDILKNSIADYVIGEYCEKCADNKICDDRNEDCYYQQAIETVITAYEKEIEELRTINQMQKYRIEVIDEKELISKDTIKEILGIEENIDNEKLLSLLQTIVDENARLEDIEDRKVQIEYNNVFNKGVKSVEDKIKAKILECRKILYSFEKELELKANKEKYIHKESMNCLLSQISILQSLLEKE